MSRGCALAVAFIALSVCSADAAPAKRADPFAADAAACARFEGHHVGVGRITAATFARPPYVTDWPGSRDSATVDAPFCRLEGFAAPVARSYSTFEIWLPARSRWNGRFLGVGAGGSMGAINTVHLAVGVNRGFATVATDNGHRNSGRLDGNHWALGERERIIDFGYRAHHLATEAGKAAVATYYGHAAQRSYYYGCSQGGQKGMMAAQRFPADYDGIVAGAPVYSWINEMTHQAWGVRAVTETPRSALTVAHLQALSEAAAKRCGGVNGLIADPRRCEFDPAELQCPRADGATCLTSEQVTAVRKIYEGPHASDGRRIYRGLTRGSERLWDQFYVDARADGSRGGGSWFGVYRHMVFDDPTWTLPQMDFDKDAAFAKRKIGPLLDPDSPDLDAFTKRGGKLIVFHGWADQQVPAEASLDYHDAVVARRSPAEVDAYFRLFMVAGMAHCSTASPGPNLIFQAENAPGAALTPERDALTALQRWVEDGEAPRDFVVRLEDDRRGITSRSVRSCAEPAAARYRGDGDPLDAANWECAAGR